MIIVKKGNSPGCRNIVITEFSDQTVWCPSPGTAAEDWPSAGHGATVISQSVDQTATTRHRPPPPHSNNWIVWHIGHFWLIIGLFPGQPDMYWYYPSVLTNLTIYLRYSVKLYTNYPPNNLFNHIKLQHIICIKIVLQTFIDDNCLLSFSYFMQQM